MQGFVAFLATFVFFSAGLRSSLAGEEMHNSSAAGPNSSVTRPGTSGEADGGGAGRAGCPERCRCEVDGLLHRVDCSDQGLREIPSNLSVFTSYL